MTTTTKLYCLFSLIHFSAFSKQEAGLGTCPVGCRCTVDHVPGIFGFQDASILNRTSTRRVATCNGVQIGNLKQHCKSLPGDLQSLTLKNNGLRNLMDLCCFERLAYLDVSFNNLSSIVTYSPFLKLSYLNLQNNNLRILRQGAFTSFPNVVILNLDNNQIHRINEETFRLFKLRELYLSRNQISYVSERTFRFTPELRILNLSGNKLLSVHSRNFYFSPNLKSIDVSYNLIIKVDDFAFDNLPELEEISLAYNNLSDVPSRSFRGVQKLKLLNLDGNPIKLLLQNSFMNLSVQQIRLSHSGSLLMVLRNSFSNLPQLKSVFLSGNEHLVYISPDAFIETPVLQMLHFEDNNLRLIPPTILKLPKFTQTDLAENPLDCACMNAVLRNTDRRRVLQNIDNTQCFIGNKRYSLASGKGGDYCEPRLLRTEAKQSVTVSLGAHFVLFCVVSSASKQTPSWSLPKGETLETAETPGRIRKSSEFLEFKFLLRSDAGEYTCSAEGADSEKINLIVQKPQLALYPVEIASYYVTLGWNQTLEPNSDKGIFFLDLTESGNPGTSYSTVLPHSTIWRSYTLTHLKPETNYSVCLVFQYDNVTLYKRCTDLRTHVAQLGMARTLNYSFIALVALCATFVTAVCLGRYVNKRFHIWQEEKYRSRMAESISGQSFLSSAESVNYCGDVAVTYENIHMSSSLYSSVSEGSASERSRIGFSSGKRHKILKESDITRDLAL